MKIRTMAAGLLLAGIFSVTVSAVPSHATDWKIYEARRIEEQNRRRRNDARKIAEQRRRRYEEERRRDLERRMYYQRKYGH